MTKWEELVALIDASKEDASKIYVRGNSDAGRRLRVAMQQVRKLAKDVRTEVQSLRKQS